MSRSPLVRPSSIEKAAASSRRARRPSLNETEFLEKALAVFVDTGFEGTSIDTITASAGIAKRTVYARFGDKETLFKAAVKQGIDQWMVPIERLRAAEHETLEPTLLAVGSILVDNILAPAGLRLLRLTNAVSGRMQAIGEYNVRYGQEPTIAYLADLFRRKLPEFRDDRVTAEDAAEVFLHLVVGGPANEAAWGVVREKNAIEQRTQLSVRIFLGGILGLLVGVPVPEHPRPWNHIPAALDAMNEASQKLDQARRQLECMK